MERHPGLEWKVGLFILTALVLLGAMIFAVRGYHTLTPGYTVKVLLHAAGGITRGAPVQFAGVKVGEVQAVTVARAEGEALPRVTLTIWLSRDLTIRADDRAQIAMLGLLGEKYVEIEPGAGQGAVVSPGGQLIGEDPISEVGLVREVEQTLQRLNGVLEQTDALLAPNGPLVRLNQTLNHLDQWGGQWGETARQTQELMRPWQAVGERMNALLDELSARWGLFFTFVGLMLIFLIL